MFFTTGTSDSSVMKDRTRKTLFFVKRFTNNIKFKEDSVITTRLWSLCTVIKHKISQKCGQPSFINSIKCFFLNESCKTEAL